MSRVINPETPGKVRGRMTKAVVLAIRELMQQAKPDSNTRDYAAFIAVALGAIDETVEKTVIPWEKRDYWVKADKFRMEWAWAKTLGEQMHKATLAEDWGEVAMLAVQVGQKLNKVEVSPRHRMGKPWVGAWDQLQEMERAG
ncbi:MAG: hypothetical protein DWQ07_12090 [Chloroflexi bacterium]|nr:MAG: hypothetical protein DWQ07_12090 [Chloroflexota bacterium]MBL1196098.1 hypothetical protein [Chloroflexota bacterium]NOH13391.1 hypothetical protein [Chloroflexota bacterium]